MVLAMSKLQQHAMKFSKPPALTQTTHGSLGRPILCSKPRKKKPAILPNLGGSLPNDIFTDVLGLKTIWVPHSYPGCSQHAPNEHLPPELLKEALQVMTGLYWDLGAGNTPHHTAHNTP